MSSLSYDLRKRLEVGENLTVESIRRFVEEDPGCLSESSYDGETMLYYLLYNTRTTEKNRVEMAKFLIENGAPTRRMCKKGSNPYTWAVEKREREFASWLLRKKNNDGEYVFDLSTPDDEDRYPAQVAAQYGLVEDLKFMYGTRKETYVKSEGEKSPLYMAISSGELECVKWFVSIDVDITVETLIFARKENKSVFNYLHSQARFAVRQALEKHDSDIAENKRRKEEQQRQNEEERKRKEKEREERNAELRREREERQRAEEEERKKKKKILIIAVSIIGFALFCLILGLIIWAATKSDDESSSSSEMEKFTLAKLPCGVSLSLVGTDGRFRELHVLGDTLLRCYSNLYDGPKATPTTVLLRGDMDNLVFVSQYPRCSFSRVSDKNFGVEMEDKIGMFHGSFEYYDAVSASSVCTDCKKYCFTSDNDFSDCKKKKEDYYIVNREKQIVGFVVDKIEISVTYGPAPNRSVFAWEYESGSAISCSSFDGPTDNPCGYSESSDSSSTTSSGSSDSSDSSSDDSWLSVKDISWYDTSISSFTLTTAEQLAGLADLVNNGNDFAGKTIKLGADIDLDGRYWYPIGDTEYSHRFEGSFDGCGHEVIGMEIKSDDEGEQYLGLFVSAAYGIIGDVAVSGNISASGSRSKVNVGGIVGKAYNVTINKCKSFVVFSIETDVTSAEYNVGGIVGYASCLTGSYINNCRFNGTLFAETLSNGADIGGVAGFSTLCRVNNSVNNGPVTGNQAGGIVGSADYAYIYNCFNSGTVIGSTKGRGILTYATNVWYVKNCYNIGNVSEIQVFSDADYSYGSNEYDIPVSKTPYSTYCPNCGVFDSSGLVTSLNNDIINNCTNLVCALNAWIDKQPDPSLFRRWKEGSQFPAEFVEDN